MNRGQSNPNSKESTVPETAPTPLQRHYVLLSVPVLVLGAIAITALELGVPLGSPLVKLCVLIAAPLLGYLGVKRDTVGSADRATVLATAALALNQVDRVIQAVRGGEAVGTSTEPPPTLDTTLEFDVNAGAIVARRWSRHPRCWC